MISTENFMSDTGKKNIYKLFCALGTVNSIFIPGCAETAAADRAAARIREIQSRMSLFEPHSEVYKINTHSGEGFIRVGGDTIGLIKKAKRFSQITNGAFNITAGPLSSLWRAAIYLSCKKRLVRRFRRHSEGLRRRRGHKDTENKRRPRGPR